jgi:hypothetical protein
MSRTLLPWRRPDNSLEPRPSTARLKENTMRSPLLLALVASLTYACATDNQIFTAVGAHDHEWTLELVEAGQDLEARNEIGTTPLIFAVFSDNLEGARILLEHGADPNARREGPGPSGSALFSAGDRAMIDLLLSHGADLELRDNDGRTALFWNSTLGNTGVVRELIAVGADVTVRDNRGNTATAAASANLLRRPRSDVEALVQLLQQSGAP